MNDKITIQQMVDREVQVCLSSLVGTLAAGIGGGVPVAELNSLMEQAFELASPIDDYEEAAIQAGWTVHKRCDAFAHESGEMSESAPDQANGWENLCNEYNIDPYQREVYEFWAVSPWFAEKLAAHGEKVDTDFAGMNVWARTTTGQGISSDGVIERIYSDMMKA